MKLAVFEVLALLKIVVKCISMFYACLNVYSRFVGYYAASQPARGVSNSRLQSPPSVTFRTHK
jgi:hypothetical protein